MQIQADSCSGTNAFINFLTSVHRHEERDTILTLLTIPNALRILWCLRSLSVEIRKTQLFDSTVESPTLNSMAETQ